MTAAFTVIRPLLQWCCLLTKKLQIQALDRAELGLPLRKARAEIMTHDYKCNGRTTLVAALTCAVTGKNPQRPVVK